MLKKRNLASYGLLLVAVVLLLLPVEVFAQSGEAVSINNGYIGVSVYRSGDSDSGSFNLWNVAGDPASALDDDQEVIYTGRAYIMADIYTGEAPNLVLSWATFDKGGILGVWGDIESDGAWSVVPDAVSGQESIRGVWSPTPTEDEWPLLIDCEQDVRIFHDMVRFKWTLTNRDFYDHQIGLKFMADPIVEPQNTGVLNGDNVISVPGFSLIEERTLFPGTLASDTRLCPSMEVYNSASSPGRGMRAVFDGMGATRPDVIGIDEYSNLASSSWGYIDDILNFAVRPKAVWGYEILPENQLIATNVCYAAFWKPVLVRAGQKRTIVHYVGIPASSISGNLPSVDHPSYVAAVTGPRIATYFLDPISGAETFGPATFTIQAFLENQDRNTDLSNCSFTLVLPAGLTLDPSETKYTKTIAQIKANTDGTVSWLVKADGTRTGILTYYVSVNAYPMGGTIVKRDIHLPAISKQPFLYGWQQMSVPFDLTDANPATALGFDPGSVIKMLRYDPSLPTSAPFYPYEEVLSMIPGEAYWMKLSRPDSTDMPIGNFAPVPWAGLVGRLIPVNAGWNMIGNPYVYAVTAGELSFFTESIGNLTYDEAIKRLMISRTIYWWNTNFNTWNWSSQRTTQLKPWQGYWIKILDSRIKAVMISPVAQIGASVGGAPPPSDGGDGGPPPPTP